jgi:hypothetical protein
VTDEAFVRLVAEDVKNRVTDQQAAYLRLPENRARWRQALQALLVNLNEQLMGLTERERSETDRLQQLGPDAVALLAELQTEMEMRRRKVERFRFYVETRGDEAERLLTIDDDGADGRTVEFFRRAIIVHRDLRRTDNDGDPDWDEYDEALWATLEGRWEFDNLAEPA